MIVDLEKVATIIAEIADREIAERFGRLKKTDISTKSSPSDFVTEADRAAERALRNALKEIYPAAGFIGEELAADDPGVLNGLSDDVGAYWIVDPLDGTRNFIQGREEYGTIVALVENGETRAGWIYAIPEQKLAIGSQGDGVAWDGAKLKPLRDASDSEPTGFRAIGNLSEPWKTQIVQRLRENFATEPARCSAYAYLHLLRGDSDFSLYSRCHPWDHAAGIMMAHELCGRAAYIDTGSLYKPVSTQGRPLLVAGTHQLFDHIANTLLDKKKHQT